MAAVGNALEMLGCSLPPPTLLQIHKQRSRTRPVRDALCSQTRLQPPPCDLSENAQPQR
jgi:hypothetical protein